MNSWTNLCLTRVCRKFQGQLINISEKRLNEENWKSECSFLDFSLPKQGIVASPSLQLASKCGKKQCRQHPSRSQIRNKKRRMEVNTTQPSGGHERHKPTYEVLKFWSLGTPQQFSHPFPAPEHNPYFRNQKHECHCNQLLQIFEQISINMYKYIPFVSMYIHLCI